MTTIKGPAGSILADSLSYIARERRWLEEWQSQGLGCVHVTTAVWEDAQTTVANLGRWRRFIRENDDLAEVARSAMDIPRIAVQGKTAVIMGFQNTAPIEHDIELVETFQALGIMVMQLTYNLQNHLGCGYWEEVDSGLSSRFGVTVVEEMNRVGMLIDLSHCGDRTTLDAVERSTRPVAVTHTNPRGYIQDSPFGPGRLVATDALDKIGLAGGFVGLSPMREIWTHGESPSVEQFADMILWTADRIGTEAIGIGSDYCPGHPYGITTWWRYGTWSRDRAPVSPSQREQDSFPSWFNQRTRYEVLADALARRGLGDSEIEGVLGGNFIRVLHEVTAT